MSNYFKRLLRGSQKVGANRGVWRIGIGIIGLGSLLVVCALIWWLEPFFPKLFTTSAPTDTPTAIPSALCLPESLQTLLTEPIAEWNRLPQQTDWQLSATDTPDTTCAATISTAASPSSLPWYSFSLVLLYPQNSGVTNLTASQWLELKQAKGALNTTTWPVEGFINTDSVDLLALSREGKRLITTPDQAASLVHLLKPVTIEGKSFTDSGYPLRVQLFWSSQTNDQQSTVLQNYLSSELIRKGSAGQFSEIVVSGPQQLGARAQFNQQPVISATQKAAIKSAEVFMIANQTTLIDRCGQRANSPYLCGKPTSLATYQPALDAVFQYGNSSLDYDYNDFVAMLQRLDKQQIRVTGGALKDEVQVHQLTTNFGPLDTVGYNIGVKQLFCTGEKQGLPAGLVCASDIPTISRSLERLTLSRPTIVWIYKPTSLSTAQLRKLIDDNPKILAVVAISNRTNRSQLSLYHNTAGNHALILPRWRFDAAAPDLFEIKLYNGQLWSMKVINS